MEFSIFDKITCYGKTYYYIGFVLSGEIKLVGENCEEYGMSPDEFINGNPKLISKHDESKVESNETDCAKSNLPVPMTHFCVNCVHSFKSSSGWYCHHPMFGNIDYVRGEPKYVNISCESLNGDGRCELFRDVNEPKGVVTKETKLLPEGKKNDKFFWIKEFRKLFNKN